MHRPLWLAALAAWIFAGPVFLVPSDRPRDRYESGFGWDTVPGAETADEIVFLVRDAVTLPDETFDGAVVAGAVVAGAVVDGAVAEFSAFANDESAAPRATVVGAAASGHAGTRVPSTGVGEIGGSGTGRPSAWVSRRAGAGGRGGGGIGQGGGGGSGGSLGRGGRMGPVPRLVPGSLIVADANGAPTFVFPLRSTVANADVAGWFASTRMTQTFANPLDRPLEAVYLFPLPTMAAVSDFEMCVGSRRVVGVVRRRAEAEAMYADALRRGRTASLVTQERVNVFTQRVGNIAPGSEVDVTVTYFHPLEYDHGRFEYVFPMTVGPRYCPSSMDPAAAARVSRPVGDDAVRSGREVAVHVVLDAGAEMGEIDSPSHAIGVRREGRTRAVVDLARRGEVPNRDFILRWTVSTESLRAGCVTHRAPDGTGYFTAFLVPPLEPAAVEGGPREVTFLIDASGSMSGAPFDTLREFVGRALSRLRGSDRFALIRFGGSVDVFAEEPVDATRDNVTRALDWLGGLRAGGGTEMLPAVRRFAAMPADPRWRRIVGFATDGFVGNEEEILAAIRAARGGARWFAFGVGSSVNRAFVEGVAEEGAGTAEIVLPGEDRAAVAAADRYLDRIETPVLCDLRLDPNGLPLTDFGTGRLRDLWSGRPIFVIGRYTEPAAGTLIFRATLAGREVEIPCAVELPEVAPAREALAPMWARERIAEWTSDMRGASPAAFEQLRERIAATALAAHLVSDATSIVCIDEDSSVAGGGISVEVPAEKPAGTR